MIFINGACFFFETERLQAAYSVMSFFIKRETISNLYFREENSPNWILKDVGIFTTFIAKMDSRYLHALKTIMEIQVILHEIAGFNHFEIKSNFLGYNLEI